MLQQVDAMFVVFDLNTEQRRYIVIWIWMNWNAVDRKIGILRRNYSWNGVFRFCSTFFRIYFRSGSEVFPQLFGKISPPGCYKRPPAAEADRSWEESLTLGSVSFSAAVIWYHSLCTVGIMASTLQMLQLSSSDSWLLITGHRLFINTELATQTS